MEAAAAPPTEQRMKRRVAGYHGGSARGQARALGKLAHTRQLCSCWMCGNPRRYLGERTLQERRADAAAATDSMSGRADG